jgi:glutamine amidotransferase
MMIAIVDYGMGNLRSVQKGFEKVGHPARVVQDPESIRAASALVLPGVGAFRDCMGHLEERLLRDPIRAHIESGKPYLGICLGLQILFTESEEFGRCEGLNIIPGKVRKFRFEQEKGGTASPYKIPHMGWNAIRKVSAPPVLADVPDGAYLYFVHSYFVDPEDATVVATKTDYGLEFTSMIWKDNIFATQFHPEKSQALGLSILKNFAKLSTNGS